jgi:hypothetical protein
LSEGGVEQTVDLVDIAQNKQHHTVTTGGVVMETDSLELVNLWKNRATQRSELAPILYDIQEKVSSFASFSVVHVSRSANQAAHACASFAVSSAFEVWVEFPPSFLLKPLQNDCNYVTE